MMRRVHEDKYTFAYRLGHFIARKMLQNTSSTIKLRIHKTNKYFYWFSKGRPGWHISRIAKQCFVDELRSGFTHARKGWSWNWNKHPWNLDIPSDNFTGKDLIIYILLPHIIFINTNGLSKEKRYCVHRLVDILEQTDVLLH